MNNTGMVYLVGAGPGDPGLITHKGLELLKLCDAVIYDRLVSDRLLDYIKEDCEKVYVGKTVGSHSMTQEEINRIIIDKAVQYTVVVRLKGGDPFVFGRGGEEVLALKEQGISYEVVPGVTSAIAAATYAGIPITHRGYSQSFHVITGHTADEDGGLAGDLAKLARLEGTIVVLMGIGNLDKIIAILLAQGKPADTPVAVISNGTTIEQQEVRGTLTDISERIREAGIKAPAVIVIGSVAGLDLKADPFRPLSGVRVGITGTKQFTGELSAKLEESGARVEILGTSRVQECEDDIELVNAIKHMEKYQWLVFTSSNAVQVFFTKLKRLSIDLRKLSTIKFAVVGSGTKQALGQLGYLADLMPEQYTVKHLAELLCKTVDQNDRLLIPRARQGSPELAEILDIHQIQYDDFTLYDVTSDKLFDGRIKNKLQNIDYLTFASASGVQGFFRESGFMIDDLPSHIKLVCIGEATDAALISYDYHNALVAEEASIKGLADCILKDRLDNI